MFQRILVPLDGSDLAASVLPIAGLMADRFAATLVLFHVIERGATQTVHGERHLAEAAEARTYLETLALELRATGRAVELHVHEPGVSGVARSINDHAREMQVDLILLCAHGRGGLRDVLIGNIAQQVMQHGATPVLFVRPQSPAVQTGSYRCRQILVPLDTNTPHEASLPVAAEIALACNAALHLLTVVPTTDTLRPPRAATAVMLPTASAAVLDLTALHAPEILQQIAGELAARGVPTGGSVARGDIASQIANTALVQAADLIVLATHARGPLAARWEGSIAPRVLALAKVPVLLVREL